MTSSGSIRDRLFSRHNLRRRIAIAVGGLTMLSVFVFGVAVWILVAVSLRSATDNDLRATATLITQFAGEENIANLGEDIDFGDGVGLEMPPGTDGRPSVPFVQVVASDGTSIGSGLPVTDRVLAVAAGQTGEVLEDIEIDGRTLRVLTVPFLGENGQALRIGTDVSNNIQGMRRARFGTSIAGVLAGLAAALAGWLGAGRLIAPVSAVAAAAEDLRRHDALPDRLEGEGGDELGRLVGSFNDLLDDLRNSRHQQRQLVADASHELRTPLTSLRVKIEFIQSQPGLETDKRQSLLDGAVADLGSLSDLVSELVELAAEGSTSERAHLVELSEVVSAEVDRFRATSGRTIALVTTPGMVETRPKQITRALSNLLVNADKYSPAEQAINVRQDGSVVEVRDHGPGISIEDRSRVFDRFYRGKGHQSIEGSGLGLSIVESVARSNGGKVWVVDPDDGESGVVVGFTVGPSADDPVSPET